MTADSAIGLEAAVVFQTLAKGETVESSHQLLVAPKCLQNRVLEMIDLIVRGICCLLPGVPGATENIRVISIVGRFLEHSPIYIFGPEDRQAVHIASADCMTRNTLRRVEVAAPVLATDLRCRLTEMFRTMLRDSRQAWELWPTGEYVRVRD